MNKIFLIFKKEMREVFRDKKSLSMMLIIPLMIPLIIIGMSFLFDTQNEVDIYEYGQIGFTYEISDIEKELIKSMEIDATYGSLDEVKKEFEDKKINLYITKEDNTYIMHYDPNSEDGSYASAVANEYLESYKKILQQQYLANSDINPDDVFNIINISEKTVEQQSFYSSYILTYSFLFIIMAITVSATYPATDATAGEKERGTLETLLTFPIKSKDIIIGKFLSVSLSSIITGILSLILALISFKVANNMFGIYENAPISLSLPATLISLFVILAFSLFISGLCIAVASMSKTFKEAQSALTPITFIAFFPGMIAFIADLKLNFLTSIIPFLNYTMIFTEISNGNYNWLYIIAMIISTFVYISIVIMYIIKEYKSEKVLFSK